MQGWLFVDLACSAAHEEERSEHGNGGCECGCDGLLVADERGLDGGEHDDLLVSGFIIVLVILAKKNKPL